MIDGKELTIELSMRLWDTYGGKRGGKEGEERKEAIGKDQ